jgi:hypothetical protein
MSGQAASQRQYSDDELLAVIDRLADGREAPSRRELINDDSAPSPGCYRRRFGSWTEALLAAGYEGNTPRPQAYDSEELLKDLRGYAMAESVPGRTQVDDINCLPSLSAYHRRWGSWRRVLAAAGLGYGTGDGPVVGLAPVTDGDPFVEVRGRRPTCYHFRECRGRPTNRERKRLSAAEADSIDPCVACSRQVMDALLSAAGGERAWTAVFKDSRLGPVAEIRIPQGRGSDRRAHIPSRGNGNDHTICEEHSECGGVGGVDKPRTVYPPGWMDVCRQCAMHGLLQHNYTTREMADLLGVDLGLAAVTIDAGAEP